MYRLMDYKRYDKILIYQYGKVGSTSLRFNNSGKYYPNIKEEYNSHIIQTHSHDVAKDVINKYKNILIINIVRFRIDRELSAFYQNIHRYCPNYKELSYDKIFDIYNNLHNDEYKNKEFLTDKWMYNLFNNLNIDIKKFNFDIDKKHTIIKLSNNNDILFYRLEDFDYIKSNILPKFSITCETKKNVGFSKPYSEIYKIHKKKYKISDIEKELILNSEIFNIFYTKEELLDYIKKYE